ncbi:MAG: membrane protein insertase YidC, partial [Candidatus Aenigmarchaeota archaeon]|nr:membrane protein insertase YidC [Candidatus Aenigmarchaeota archaeon]
MIYLYKLFFNILIGIYAIIPGHDLGISIIILTILIRLVLWPLASKALHGQRKLQEIQPAVAKIKEKAKGDKQKEAQLLMELYKEKEVNPFSSCLPSLVQFPFLIALFIVFKDWLNVVHINDHAWSFIKDLPYIQKVLVDPSIFSSNFLGFLDLSLPNRDHLITTLPWFYYILPILAALSQWYQGKMLLPKTQDPSQKTAGMMTLFSPFLILFFGFSLPAA